MTFSFQPHRSSSDDDALDQHLNDWVAGSRHDPEPMSGHAADALEFHRWADSALGTDLAATGPAAGTWNRILRNSAQEKPKGTREMSTATLSSPSTGFSSTPRESAGQSIRRYSNTAATIALVLAIAVGGWLAMSQMTPGGEGRFAAIQATPEVAQAQTCNVEPLTVDEVMAIVENPYSVAPFDYWGTPAPGDDVARLAGEGHTESPLALRLPDKLTEVPDVNEFQKIHEAANTYLNCQLDGTVGQFMAVTHPESLQFYVLSNFPVYRDQQTIRSFIEEVIDLPAIQVSSTFSSYPDGVSPQFIRTTASDDRNRVRVADHSGPSLLSDRIAYVGVDTLDEDGNVIGQTDWDATLLLGGSAENNGGHSLIMVYAEATDSWYVYGYNAPRG